MRPYIDQRRCDMCGECIDTCPYDVFSIDEGGLVVVGAAEDCIECTACMEQCKKNAIYMDD
ncbi:MAG: ferredoxin family protein [Syntrophorhabdaceae bacterium]|nr:ferredoxin family protein [Syntrophorhabdaceae bacterium]